VYTRSAFVSQSSFFSLVVLSFLSGTLDVGTVGSVESGQSSESKLLGLVIHESKCLDRLGSGVHLRSESVSGEAELGLGVGSLGSLATGAGSGLEVEGENSSEMFFGFFLLSRDTEGASGVGGVVEVRERVGSMGPLLSLELDEVGIVFSGEGPNDARRSFHSY